MMVTTACDICRKNCGRWYEITVQPATACDWQNIADMIPIGSLGYRHQVCKPCYDTLIEEITAMQRQRGLADDPEG